MLRFFCEFNYEIQSPNPDCPEASGESWNSYLKK